MVACLGVSSACPLDGREAGNECRSPGMIYEGKMRSILRTNSEEVSLG